MKKVLFLIIAVFITLPIFAQSKEEQEAKQNALYEVAKEALEEKDWVIVPNEIGSQSSTDQAIFIAYEKSQMIIQGRGVCGNSETNIAEVKDYKIKVSKKGDITLTFRVLGRKIKGSYIVRIKNGSNYADCIFTPAGNTGGETLKFRGPLVKTGQSKYIKRSNAI